MIEEGCKGLETKISVGWSAEGRKSLEIGKIQNLLSISFCRSEKYIKDAFAL